MKLQILFTLCVVSLTVAGCSGSKGIKHKRDVDFFQPLMNSSENYESAEQKISELKLVTVTQVYNMRYALFDNGKFYYEVDNLGKGYGTWKFQDGHVTLHAVRPVFDMDLNLMAAEANGNTMGMQFLDRFGYNTVVVQVREPATKKPLKKFTENSAL